MASPSNRAPGGRPPSSPSRATASRPLQRASQARLGQASNQTPEDSGRVAEVVSNVGRRGARITWRLVALIVVLAVLMFSYANSLRVYFSQQSQIAAAKAELAANQQTVNDLYDQLQRWQDPAYVKAQARERLGWVMPGEVGYHVIGPDGKPLGAGATISTASALPAGEHAETWWDRLAGSVLTADDPTPVPDAADQAPITVDTPPR